MVAKLPRKAEIFSIGKGERKTETHQCYRPHEYGNWQLHSKAGYLHSISHFSSHAPSSRKVAAAYLHNHKKHKGNTSRKREMEEAPARNQMEFARYLAETGKINEGDTPSPGNLPTPPKSGKQR